MGFLIRVNLVIVTGVNSIIKITRNVRRLLPTNGTLIIQRDIGSITTNTITITDIRKSIEAESNNLSEVTVFQIGQTWKLSKLFMMKLKGLL